MNTKPDTTALNTKVELLPETLVDATLEQITGMILESVENQKKVNPIYQTIQNNILGMLEKEEELLNMEHKDLFKLLDLATKAQIQPVETLTKLVQAATALQNSSQIELKIAALDSVVKKLQQEAEDKILLHEEDTEAFPDVEDLE